MSKETPSTAPKRPMVSIPFLIGACVLGVAAYFAGPSVMTYVMYLQERRIATAYEKDEPGSARVDANMAADRDSSEGNNQERAAGGPGGSFDPEQMFADRDKDGNGKLEGDEISERMKRGLEQIDTDKDGAVSKEEFMKRMEQRAGGGAGGGGPGSPFPETPTADSSSTAPAADNGTTPEENPPKN
jgi:EF hand